MRKKFSSVSGVSNNMLVTLSLAHLSSRKFEDHESMVKFLAGNGFLNFKETQKSMMQHDRKDFLQEIGANPA